MDGHKQRQALSAAERALGALIDRAQGSRAIDAAAKAENLDQVGLFHGLQGAVARAAAEIEARGYVSPAVRKQLLDVVGPGPLEAHIDRIPSGE